MDYKEKYEIGLEGIQEILGSGEDSIKMSRLKLRLQGIFPELKESEDERIRKAIKLMYSFLPNEPTYIGDVPVKDIFAWLEKQGEQKPTIEMKSVEESLCVDSDTYNKIVDECVYGEQKPTWKPSNEQIEALESATENCAYSEYQDCIRELIEQLKKL